MPDDDRISALRELLAADPGDRDLPFLLGKALLDAGEFDEAAARLAAAAEANPDLAAIRRHWGEALRDAGRPDEARRVWEAGIETSERTRDLQAGKEMRALLKRLG